MENSTTILTNPIRPAGNAAALTVLVVGFIAAFGAGKLPPVLPQVQSELDISLVQAGVLVSCFQLAGALMGMLAGALADRFGQKNLMMLGMLALAVGSATGAMSDTALLLLVSRAIESIGFVLAVLPGPALLRTAVSENHLSRCASPALK